MKDRSLKQIYIDLHWFRFRLIYIVWVYMLCFISFHVIPSAFGYEAQDDVMIGDQVYWRTFFDSKALKGSKVQLWSSVRWNGMSIACIKLYTRIYRICIFTVHTYNAHIFYGVEQFNIVKVRFFKSHHIGACHWIWWVHGDGKWPEGGRLPADKKQHGRFCHKPLHTRNKLTQVDQRLIVQ